MDEIYNSYKRLYRQPFTIPLGPLAKYVGNVPIDFGHIITYGVVVMIFAFLYGLFLGDTAIFGLPRMFWSLLLGFPVTYWLLKRDTIGLPLHVFLVQIFRFFFRNHWFFAFQPIPYPKKKSKLQKKVRFRNVVQSGDKLLYPSFPVEGMVERIDGLHLQTSGATRIEFHPLSKKMRLKVGSFDSQIPKSLQVKKHFRTVMEVGKGVVRVQHRTGNLHVMYEPYIEKERRDE